MNFDFVTLLGGVMILLGSIGIIRSGQKRGWDRVRRIVVGILFALTGLAMMKPLVPIQRQREMLSLQTDAISMITIYDENRQGKLLAQTDDRALLSDWASILKTCQYHRAVHPLYEKTYLAEVEYHADNFDYELNLDSRDPNTVDLQPLESSTILSITVEFSRGVYRCSGLYDFLLGILQFTK